MAYRNDVDALEARLAAVQRDLDATTRDRDETARLLAEARDRANNDALAADYAAGGPQRRRRRQVAIVTAAAVAALGGGGLAYKLTRGPTAAERFERMLADGVTFEHSMCGCKDKACAEAVNDELNRWATQLAKEHNSDTEERPNEEQMQRVTKVFSHYGECMTDLMTPPAQ